MQNYAGFALGKLKDAGLKLTNPRKLIVNFLAHSDKVLSPYEMRRLLKKQKISADVVTIYRVLEVLEKNSLAHKVLTSNGYIRCSKSSGNTGKTPCHHYLVCRKCQRVEEVEGENISSLIRKISNKNGFKISAHYLEFEGLCSKCGGKTASKRVSSGKRK